jgi:hypothetical protein
MNASKALKPISVYEAPEPDSALSRAFLKIVIGSTALGLGCLAAAVEALRQDTGGFAFHVSAGTFVAFAVGLAAGLYYWKLAAKSPLAARVATAFLVLAGIGGFLYPLRFVPSDKMGEIATGLGVAACAISIGAVLLWRLKLFFDADDAAVQTKKS